MRSTLIWVPGGRSLRIWFRRDSTICWLCTTFTFQLKNAEISQLPRLVVERSRVMPGTCFMAFSSGLVTVTIMRSTGCRPLSAITFTFGKVTSGNSATLMRR